MGGLVLVAIIGMAAGLLARTRGVVWGWPALWGFGGLGLILYDGKVVTRDNVTAAQWIYLASDQKHVEARRLLNELQLFLTAEELAEARKRADDFKPVQRARSMPEP